MFLCEYLNFLLEWLHPLDVLPKMLIYHKPRVQDGQVEMLRNSGNKRHLVVDNSPHASFAPLMCLYFRHFYFNRHVCNI